MIAVIIVTYNASEFINKCLQCVVKNKSQLKIFISDNNSTDDTIDIVKNLDLNVSLFENKENLGFGAANNQCFIQAMAEGCSHFFLVNQDVYLPPNAIDSLIEIENNYKFDMFSPIQLNGSGEWIDRFFKVHLLSSFNAVFFNDLVLSKSKKKVYECGFTNAAAWFIPLVTLKKIGGFDPLFWHYGEDDDWYQRFRYKELKAAICTDILVRHDRQQEPRKFQTLSSVFKLEKIRMLIRLKKLEVRLIKLLFVELMIQVKIILRKLLLLDKSFIVHFIIMICVFFKIHPVAKSRKISKSDMSFINDQ